MKELAELFLLFCRIGGFTFGGGYAMLPIIQQEVVDKRHWATEEEVLDYYAIGQCTPGIIAVNTATFIGYKRKGIAGGVAATAGMVFPSLVIIIIIAAFIQNFADLAVVQHAFGGIRVAVGALVANAVVKMWKAGVKDKVGVVLFAIAFVLNLVGVSPVVMVVAAVVAGIAVMRVRRKGGRA